MVGAEDLIEVLESLYPGLDPGGETEPGKPKQPSEVARELLILALGRSDVESSSEWSDLMVLIEALLQKGADPPWDGFAGSFVEDLLNAVSHGDLPPHPWASGRRVLSQYREWADYFDRVWVSRPDDQAPNVMDPEKFASISNPDLRWTIRFMFRRTLEDTYVGTADILRREAETGRPGGLDS